MTKDLEAVSRKLSHAAQRDMQINYVGEPGIPPLGRKIGRKNLQLPSGNEVGERAVVFSQPRYHYQWDQVCAILPAYLPGGVNGCHVYFIDGTCDVYAHRMEWVLDHFLRHLLTSRKLVQEQSIQWMGGTDRRRVPLAVNDDLCLIPVNCRSTQRRNDGTTGYVVLRYIDTVYPIHKWRSCHRDEEDLYLDYHNYVLNHTQTNQSPMDTALSILTLRPTNHCTTQREQYKLILRDTHTTIQNNIYLGNQIVKKHNIVRENKKVVRTG